MTTLEIVETIEFDELVISQQVTSVEVYSNVSIGPTGPKGYLVDSWRGPWDGSITSGNSIYREYGRGDIVSHKGALWVALVDSNAEFDFPGASDKWEKLIERSILLELWEGAWEPYAYSRGSVVSYDGSVWIAVSDVLDTDVPGATIGTWDLMVSKGDAGNIAHYWRGAWTATTYDLGDVVTHDGSTWLALGSDPVATQEPGGDPVPVVAGSILPSLESTIASATWWQQFILTSEALITHIAMCDSGGALCELRDHTGSVLATYTPTGIENPVALSAPVLLAAGPPYSVSTISSRIYSDSLPFPVTGILAPNGYYVRKGVWPGTTISGTRYQALTLYNSPSTPWVTLAAKGVDGIFSGTYPFQVISSPQSIPSNYGYYFISGSGEYMMPNSSTMPGQKIDIKNISAYTVTVTSADGMDNSQSIDLEPNAMVSLFSISSKWVIV